MNKKTHLPINWTTGVKVGQDHFFGNYFSRIEMLQAYASMNLNKMNYGILDKIDEQTEAIKLEVDTSSDSLLYMKLRSCHAITAGGYLILYHKQFYGDNCIPSAKLDLEELGEESVDQKFLVIISINPFKLLPVGEPDPECIPLHHPYALPEISLHIIPEKQANTNFFKNHHLIVGEIFRTSNRLVFNEKYIPPVKKICYSPPLSNFQQEVVRSLIRIKEYSLQVFRKNKNNNNRNILADNTFILCDDVSRFYSEHIFSLEHLVAEEAPVYLVEKLSILANYISMSLNTMVEKDREILLQYYYEWSDIKPSQLTHNLGQVLSLQYEHINIAASLHLLQRFVSMLEQLFKKLSELEYIGLRKENIVVSDDSAAENKSKEPNSWTLLD